jgi:hypothetical protein
MKTKRARKSGNDACSSTISIMEESPRKQHRRSVNPAVVQMRVPGVRSINAEGSEAPRLQTQDKRRLLNSPTFGQATQHGGVWMVSLFSTCCLPRSDGAAMANEARGAAIAPMVLLAVGCFWVSVGDGRSNTISLPAKFRATDGQRVVKVRYACKVSAIRVKTRQHWFNPCAFADPPLSSAITAPVSGGSMPEDGRALEYLSHTRRNWTWSN